MALGARAVSSSKEQELPGRGDYEWVCSSAADGVAFDGLRSGEPLGLPVHRAQRPTDQRPVVDPTCARRMRNATIASGWLHSGHVAVNIDISARAREAGRSRLGERKLPTATAHASLVASG